MSPLIAMRFALVGLGLSLVALGIHTAVAYLHAPLALPPLVMNILNVFGTSWPIWAYAWALYRRHLNRAKAAAPSA